MITVRSFTGLSRWQQAHRRVRAHPGLGRGALQLDAKTRLRYIGIAYGTADGKRPGQRINFHYFCACTSSKNLESSRRNWKDHFVCIEHLLRLGEFMAPSWHRISTSFLLLAVILFFPHLGRTAIDQNSPNIELSPSTLTVSFPAFSQSSDKSGKPVTVQPKPLTLALKNSNIQSMWYRFFDYKFRTLPVEGGRLSLNVHSLGVEGVSVNRFILLGAGSCSDDSAQNCSQIVLVDVASPPYEDHWVGAFKVTTDGIEVLSDAFLNGSVSFAINGQAVTRRQVGLIFGSRDMHDYHIELFDDPDGCRKYMLRDAPGNEKRYDSIDVEIPYSASNQTVDNGITVGAPKVYDTYALQRRMQDAAQQLSNISPWNAAAITNNYGSLQGIKRDTSYLSAQAETAGAPNIQTVTNGGLSLQSPQQVTNLVQCPPGYSASIDNSGTTTCAPPSATGGTSQGTGSLVPAFSSTQTTQPTTQTTVTANGISASAAPVPSSSPLAPPSNISVSSSDLLVEQVQLSAQLQMYQMLWRGSQSDQFLLRNSRAIAPRGQTTIGFDISLSPPRQYKHAVAEVRVIVVPHLDKNRHVGHGDANVSIVNLLPSQKTYNVARVTSHQNAFGASAVVDQVVNLGVSTGRAKDRLYLVKDTDTVALQYPDQSATKLDLSWPEMALEGVEEAAKMQRLGECDDLELKSTTTGNAPGVAPVLFGWQFRPVLGADYVAAGPREVFAQLALPIAGDEIGFAPAVYVQTRWREYDQKHEVVGPVYRASCSLTRVQDAIAIDNPPRVRDVRWDDIGNGLVKVRATGTLLSTGMSILSGANAITPTIFDGSKIQFIAPARDLIQNGDVELLGENGKTTPLSIQWKPKLEKNHSCDIENVEITAVPVSGGDSTVEMRVRLGDSYRLGYDGEIDPLVLIGKDVYGMREKPYQIEDNPCTEDQDKKVTCSYIFRAPTDALRTAQTFVVRDLVRDGFEKSGSIIFGPSLAELRSVKTGDPAKVKIDAKDNHNHNALAEAPNVDAETFFIDGADLESLCDGWSLSAIVDGRSQKLSVGGCRKEKGEPQDTSCEKADVCILTATEAILKLAISGNNDKVGFLATSERFDQPRTVLWDLDNPHAPAAPKEITANPPFLQKGDSRTVAFSGVDFSAVKSVVLGGNAISFSVPGDDPTTLKTYIGSSISQVPGMKELRAETVDSKGKKGTIVLKLEIVPR